MKEINKHLFTLSWLNKINQKEVYERVKVAGRGYNTPLLIVDTQQHN